MRQLLVLQEDRILCMSRTLNLNAGKWNRWVNGLLRKKASKYNPTQPEKLRVIIRIRKVAVLSASRFDLFILPDRKIPFMQSWSPWVLHLSLLLFIFKPESVLFFALFTPIIKAPKRIGECCCQKTMSHMFIKVEGLALKTCCKKLERRTDEFTFLDISLHLIILPAEF